MKMNAIFLLSIILLSCDSNGNISLQNGYRFKIRAETVYDYQGTVIKKSTFFETNMFYFPAAMGNKEYNHIIAIRLFTMEGDLLAEYSTEYIKKLRNAYKMGKNQGESWTFTEKGLFIRTREVAKRYKFNTEKILKYYQSDEAQSDLEMILNG
jgi:uncharacterized protein YjhX (UPF0386 family)